VSGDIRVPIRSDQDIVAARQRGRELALSMGFSACEATLVATAISELARNIVLYARVGEIQVQCIEQPHRKGIAVVARDDGPGIANVRQAIQDGFSTSGGLGLGLPGVRRLMDEFEIDSKSGQGTRVTARKWLP
jgi:serine/threonine-protein kinase RsbT